MKIKMSSEASRGKLAILMVRATMFVILIAAVVLSGRFTNFMNAYGLVFVLLGGAALALMSFSFHEIVAAFKDTGKTNRNAAEIHQSTIFWESASRNYWMVGALATLVAFVVAMTSEGGIQGITERMATSLIPTVYGAILSVVCLVPALKLRSQRTLDLRDEPTEENEVAISTSSLAHIVGYTLFITMIIGVLIRADMNATEPIFSAWGWVMYWPSLLIVFGGTVAIATFVGTAAGGQTFTFGFAVTGFVGSLMGCIQVLLGFSARSIEEIAAAMTFVLSSCFFALLGMMLIGAPLEDRTLKTTTNARHSTMSRVAWYVFPLVTLILLVVTFVLVITPMTVPK